MKCEFETGLFTKKVDNIPKPCYRVTKLLYGKEMNGIFVIIIINLILVLLLGVLPLRKEMG